MIRNIFRRIWYAGWIFVASFLIMLALVFSAIRMMLPLATDYQADIESYVSRLLGHPAQIARIDTDWHWFKPRLKLIGVRLDDGASGSELFAAEEVILAMNPFSSAMHRRVEIDELTVVRTNFSLRRDAAGRFYAQGFALPVMERSSAAADLPVPPFLHDRTLRVIDSVAAFADDKSGINYRLEAVNLTVQTGARDHRAYLSVLLPEEIGRRFEAGLELRGDLRDLPGLKGRVYVQATALELPMVLQKTPYRDSIKSGRLDIALWADLDSDARRELQGNVSLQGFAGDFSGVPLLSGFKPPFDGLSADLRARLEGTGLELELENLLLARGEDVAPLNGLALKTSVDRNSLFAHGEVMIDHLRLKDVWPVAVQHPQLREALDKAAIQAVSGNILQFYGKWDAATRDIALSSRFEELGISGSGKTPSVSALRGRVRLLNKTAVMELETAGSQFDYPRLFRNKLELRNLAGSIFARYDDSGLTLATRNLFLQTPHIVSRHWFDLIFAHGRPYANMYSTYEDGDLKAAGGYLPVTIMSKKLVDWLDTGIIDGRLAAGDFELKGPLGKFPFRSKEGIFRIDTDFEGMELNYFDDWPHLREARLHTKFFGATLAIAIHEGEISGLDIVGADTWITDFHTAWLIAQVPLYGPLAGIVDYLRTSGLRKSFDPLIDRIEAAGMHAGFLRLDIPLHHGPDTLWYLDSSIFDGDIAFLDAGLKFTHLNSDLRLDHESIYATPFSASLNGHPLDMDITTYAEAGNNTARITLAGDVVPADLLPQSLNPAAYLTGTASLSAAVDLPLTGAADARRHPAIDLKLGAAGTAIDLPVPFTKAAGIPVDLSVYTEFREKAVLVDVGYAGWLDGKLRFESGALERGDIRFSDGKPKLPASAGVLLSGRVEELNVDQWLALKPAGTAGAASPLQRLELKTRKLTYLKRTLDNAVLQLTQKSRHWVAAVESEFLTGSVAIPKQEISAPGLAFNVKYGDLDRLLSESPMNDKQLVPADIPTFSLDAETIILNGWNLRQLKLEADVDAARQTLQGKLAIGDPDVGMQGTAEWSIDKKGMHRTETTLNFDSKNIGRGMGKFGYAEMIRDGSGTAKFDVSWPAPPHKFSLKQMDGEAQISLKDGQILEIEPGGGRLFGLLSVQTIPRRLAFDFKDIFSEGFHFDKMKGNFDFSNGNAYTDNYYIDGPAGRIDIKGRVGMAQRDYDQRVVFRPDLSSSLPIVGTLLGGTGTGLALIVADRVARLFGKQADDLARLEYTLTGSWDNPVMTAVKQQSSKKAKKVKDKNKDK